MAFAFDSVSSVAMISTLFALMASVVACLLWRRTRHLEQQNVELAARVETLRQSEARFHAIADYTYGVEAWLNPKGKLIWINRSIERLTEYSPLECLLAKDLVDMLVMGEERSMLRKQLARALVKRSDGMLEVRFLPKQKSPLWVTLNWQAIHGKDGTYLGLRVSADDIQYRKEAEAMLVNQATRDSLTGLYNRRRFHEELSRMLADAKRRNVRVGLLAIDLDGFKPINDQFGHQAGDEVLVAMANKVGAGIRRSEMFFRLGGDEFAVLVGDATETEMIGLAERISTEIAGLQFCFAQTGQTALTASVGIALYPDHAVEEPALIAAADLAMYGAKHTGKNSWQIASAH